jgi:type IV pilus assembly protein PilW
MRTTNTPPPAVRAQRGFTLIELMVSLLLGLVSVLVITQVLFESEGRRRTVSMGGDAQTNGAMSLYTLQRDIQMSGYGLTASPDALGCDVKAKFGTFAAFSFTLAPVVIEDGAAGAPDSITVLRGRTSRFSLPMTLTEAHTPADQHFLVTSSFGAAAGNMMIAVPKKQDPATWCSLLTVTDDLSGPISQLTAASVPHLSGTGAANWNQNSIFPAGGYLKNDYLLNMESVIQRTYSINANNLQMTERSAVDGSQTSRELYPQIVTLQAMYGKGSVDAGGNVHVDSYDSTTPSNNAEWRRVVSIRIALVARSNQYEKDEVTPGPPKWDVGGSVAVAGTATSTCNGSSTCIDLNVSQVGADWKHYRYKVFDTIVPLRNVLWNAN